MALAVYVKHLCFVVAVWSKDDWNWFFTDTKTWGQRGEANTEACDRKRDQMRLTNVWIILYASGIRKAFCEIHMWKTLCEVLTKTFFFRTFLWCFLKPNLKRKKLMFWGDSGWVFLWAFVDFPVGPLMELISLAVQFFSYCIFKVCCMVPCEHQVPPDE